MSTIATNRAGQEVSDEQHFWASFRAVSADNPVVDLTKANQRLDIRFNTESGVTVVSVRPNLVSLMLVKLVKRTEPDDIRYLTEAGIERNQAMTAPPVPAPGSTKPKVEPA